MISCPSTKFNSSWEIPFQSLLETGLEREERVAGTIHCQVSSVLFLLVLRLFHPGRLALSLSAECSTIEGCLHTEQ